MSDESDKVPELPHKSRWYQYSLRSLLLVITFLCIWLAYISNEARKQKAAVAWVEEMGGEVGYDYEYYMNGSDDQQNSPPGPDWLREWIGIDYFSEVVLVNLQGKKIEDISPLQCLTKLKRLNLIGSQLSDISTLEKLTELDHLGLSLAQIHDLSPLKGLTNLEMLSLEGNHVKDLGPLKELKRLKELYFHLPKVRDFSDLNGLRNLKSLRISGTQIADQQVQKLQKALPNCYIVFWDGEQPPPDAPTRPVR